ncbi:MAG TPA: hypothetical protein VK919_15895 [Solirubrobacterales bacterium]|nr:hypothetical protein [Solirubrobacterales bacterium]
MRRRGPVQSLAASPVMIGAVTTLIVVVAVFLAYNANRGLPFVPVYRVAVDVPNSARLVDFNEVRIGGYRVGVVESLEPVLDGEARQTVESASGPGEGTGTDGAVARIYLKLDEAAAPIPKDSIFRVGYRSSFGLKYLEIVRGVGEPAPEGFTFDGTNDTADCMLPEDPDSFAESAPASAGDGCFQEQTEFDAINSTFDTRTRRNARRNLTGFGDGFAGRGTSLNDAIDTLEPLFRHLRPVGEVLAADETRLRRFFPALGRAARIVAPVAVQQAEMFTRMAITFNAISESPEALRETISEGPPTLETGIETLPRQRTFLREFEQVSRELRPGIEDAAETLPVLNDAARTGTPVLDRSPDTNRRLTSAFETLDRTVNRPVTRVVLERFAETFDMARPLARWVVPAQTVCNHWNYWFTHLPGGFDRTPAGMTFRQILVNFPLGSLSAATPLGTLALPGMVETPLGGYSGKSANGIRGQLPLPAQASRPEAASQPPGTFMPFELPVANSKPYMPTGQDGHDCQGGQWGYMLGDVSVPGQPDDVPAVVQSNLEGSRGATTLFWNDDKQRELHDTRVPSRQPRTWEAFGDLPVGGGR